MLILLTDDARWRETGGDQLLIHFLVPCVMAGKAAECQRDCRSGYKAPFFHGNNQLEKSKWNNFETLSELNWGNALHNKLKQSFESQIFQKSHAESDVQYDVHSLAAWSVFPSHLSQAQWAVKTSAFGHIRLCMAVGVRHTCCYPVCGTLPEGDRVPSFHGHLRGGSGRKVRNAENEHSAVPVSFSSALQIVSDRLAAPNVAAAEDDCKALLLSACHGALTATCKQHLGRQKCVWCLCNLAVLL